MNYNEEICRKIEYSITNIVPDATVRSKLSVVLANVLKDYTVTCCCTELVTVDCESDNLIKFYAGSMESENKSKGTIKQYVHFLHMFYTYIGKPLKDVTSLDITSFLANKKLLSATTRNNYRNYLSAFYKWLEFEGIISENPMKRIRAIKEDKRVKPYFSDVELSMLREGCSSLRDRAMIEFFISTGMRVNEVSLCRIGDVDIYDRRVLVKNGKGGKQRYAYLTDIAARYLKQYLASRTDANECLFLSKKGGNLKPCSIRLTMKKLGERCGVDDVHPHKFRRTLATTFGKKGVAIQNIQKMLGHNNIGTTMEYIVVDDSDVQYAHKKYA